MLTLDGDRINVHEVTKLFSLIFDAKLYFMSHIKYLKTRCLRALDILRVLSSSEWRADREPWFSHDWINEARPNYIQPLMLQIKPHFEALSIDLDVLEDT